MKNRCQKYTGIEAFCHWHSVRISLKSSSALSSNTNIRLWEKQSWALAFSSPSPSTLKEIKTCHWNKTIFLSSRIWLHNWNYKFVGGYFQLYYFFFLSYDRFQSQAIMFFSMVKQNLLREKNPVNQNLIFSKIGDLWWGSSALNIIIVLYLLYKDDVQDLMIP